MGGYLSFSGILTFPKSTENRDIARDVPADRLLVETDAPYLAPVPFRGKRNEPSYVAKTAAVLAGAARAGRHRRWPTSPRPTSAACSAATPPVMRVTILGCGGSAGVPQVGGADGHGDWGACDPAEPRNRRTRSVHRGRECAPGNACWSIPGRICATS